MSSLNVYCMYLACVYGMGGRGGQRMTLGVSFYHHLPSTLKQGLSLNSELADLTNRVKFARMTSCLSTAGIKNSQPHLLGIHVVLESEHWSLHF